MTDPTCAACERRTVPERAWKRADDTQRQLWRESGMVRGSGRGLCKPCYTKHYKAGTLDTFPRVTVPRRDVVDDWQHLAAERAGMSRAQAVQVLAPRMGMTPDALEKALDRAGIGGGHVVRDQSGRWTVAA